MGSVLIRGTRYSVPLPCQARRQSTALSQKGTQKSMPCKTLADECWGVNHSAASLCLCPPPTKNHKDMDHWCCSSSLELMCQLCIPWGNISFTVSQKAWQPMCSVQMTPTESPLSCNVISLNFVFVFGEKKAFFCRVTECYFLHPWLYFVPHYAQ